MTNDNGTYGPRLDYYVAKGWFPAVFKIEHGKNTFLMNTQDYPSSNHSIQNHTSIISFQQNVFTSKFQIALSSDEESKISIKRRTVPLQSVFSKSQLKFLIKQMNLGEQKTKMYCNEKYTVSIEFSNIMPSDPWGIGEKKEFEIGDVVEDYRDFGIESFDEWKKITLAFLNRYVWYLIASFIYSDGNLSDKQKGQLQELLNMHAKSNAYSDVKLMYRQQIKFILNSLADEDLTLSEFLKVEKALEKFLTDAEKYKVSYSYKEDNLLIEISKESILDGIDFLFENFIDENMHKNMNKRDSIMHNFLKINIQWLSDGERENLALFTSIAEQIALYPDKKQYILLFDEIERSMHPDLCRSLIVELMDFLMQYPDKQFQIIIASHSPFIASDLLKENIVCLRRTGDRSEVTKMDESSFAQNVHTILKSQFFLDAFLGKYAIKCIGLVIECLTLEKSEDVMQKINTFLVHGDANNLKRRISTIGEAKQFIEFVIGSIGEPLIRNELSHRLSSKVWGSAEEKILYYREKIAELEGKIHD